MGGLTDWLLLSLTCSQRIFRPDFVNLRGCLDVSPRHGARLPKFSHIWNKNLGAELRGSSVGGESGRTDIDSLKLCYETDSLVDYRGSLFPEIFFRGNFNRPLIRQHKGTPLRRVMCCTFMGELLISHKRELHNYRLTLVCPQVVWRS